MEKPRRRLLEELAAALKEPRTENPKNLLVLGPAVVHSGAVEDLERLLDRGLFQVLFGGNAIAAHDIEYALLGTSLGVEVKTGRAVPGGHRHHLKAINTIRGLGGIRLGHRGRGPALGHHASRLRKRPGGGAGRFHPRRRPPARGGHRRRRRQAPDAGGVKGVGVAVMVATALHSIATGNLLPARVKTYCVDINPSTVTKLMDRGSAQATPSSWTARPFFTNWRS